MGERAAAGRAQYSTLAAKCWYHWNRRSAAEPEAWAGSRRDAVAVLEDNTAVAAGGGKRCIERGTVGRELVGGSVRGCAAAIVGDESSRGEVRFGSGWMG